MVFLQQRTTRITQRTKYPAQYWRHEHVWRGLDLAKTEAASYTVCPKCSRLRVNQIWLLGPDVIHFEGSQICGAATASASCSSFKYFLQRWTRLLL